MRCSKKVTTVLQLMRAHLETMIMNLEGVKEGVSNIRYKPAFDLITITYENKGVITRAIGCENYNKIKGLVARTVDSFALLPGKGSVHLTQNNARETVCILDSML